MDILELKRQAVETRRNLLRMIYRAKTGHTGGSLSSADLMTALYFNVLHVDPKNPKDPGRDFFILSKGHCVESFYAVLAERGFFPLAELDTFSQYGSRLTGHPTNHTPGIEVNTGALGHGLPIAVGVAIGLKRQGLGNRVFCLMGDGEQAEGSIWEACMAASNYHLDNLTAIVDRNGLQISGSTEEVMALENLHAKYRSFGWKVREIDGNKMEEIVPALKGRHPGKPLMVIAHTVKGKGVREMENVASWHHGVPSEELYRSALAQLDLAEKELR